ncbi:MAG TPA: DUF871 family protein [Candidatus Ligilactobacillus excrementavium]|nr:DUF871 family protein [Candidatus Ligilactobacillus excrementavium]
MFGFSIYLSAPITSEIKKKINRLSKAGFSGVFTSLNLPEDDPSVLLQRLTDLGAECRRLRIELTVDISTVALERLSISLDKVHELTDLGVTQLRIDDGIPMPSVSELSQKMGIALNASTISEEDISLLQENHANFENLEAWHNYYPRRNTGLEETWFDQRNAWLKENGFTVTAFAPGDSDLRGPVYATLPTLESGRYQHPLSAALNLLQNNVDNVYIGDEGLQVETAAQFDSYFRFNTLLLHANDEVNVPEYLSDGDFIFHQRPDVARDAVRLREGRSLKEGTIEPANVKERSRGAITLDNKLAQRYEGELQLIKCDLPVDPTVNVLGYISSSDLDLLGNCEAGQAIQLVF